MKKLFSKKSGFTLVEIVVALAIFAIFASFIAQVVSLAIQRKNSNLEFEKNVQIQQELLVANDKNTDSFTAAEADGELNLKFDGLDAMKINYQLKSAEGNANDKYGINYFVGDINYDVVLIGGTQGVENNTPGGNNGSGTQNSRFDTRITGSKGIQYIKVEGVAKNSPTSYTITVRADNSGMMDDVKKYGTYSLYFPNAKIKNVTGSGSSGPDVRQAGDTAVKVSSWNYGSITQSVTFTVEFETAPTAEITVDSFGSNGSYGKYTPFNGNVNIFGAYAKQ